MVIFIVTNIEKLNLLEKNLLIKFITDTQVILVELKRNTPAD